VRDLLGRIRAVAAFDSTVLLHGESGTGKELVAKHIHAASPRAPGPFVPVDCTTLRDTLFESQLFGHVRGAFTGAESHSLGFVRSAEGGTLFLDEIAELAPALQAKLLRCLQERTVTPLGAATPVQVDVRIIAATHRDLRTMVRAGSFREDLYYRLNVVRLMIPPLRERGGDIPLLADHLLASLAEDCGLPRRTLSPQAAAAIEGHSWPGNVRELANTLERAVIVSRVEQIAPDDLPEEVLTRDHAPSAPDLTLAAAERRAIEHALSITRGNKARASRLLAIDPRRLDRKLRALGIAPARTARA
jgi:two-component system response regulator AtoC